MSASDWAGSPLSSSAIFAKIPAPFGLTTSLAGARNIFSPAAPAILPGISFDGWEALQVTPKTETKETLSTILIGRWEQTGNKLTALAEEFPAGKYETRPVDGVRTFGDVLRHVAFWNRFVADTMRGEKADGASDELARAEFSTKARIVDALKGSAGDAASALREQRRELDMKTAELIVTFIEHTCEHYGQLVVYSRLMGIIPPTSRA